MASECEKGYRCSPILSLKDGSEGSEAEAGLEKVRTQNEVLEIRIKSRKSRYRKSAANRHSAFHFKMVPPRISDQR